MTNKKGKSNGKSKMQKQIPYGDDKQEGQEQRQMQRQLQPTLFDKTEKDGPPGDCDEDEPNPATAMRLNATGLGDAGWVGVGGAALRVCGQDVDAGGLLVPVGDLLEGLA